ncbi:cleavage polyadenylation factor subunit fip1 [Blastocladiella emersonii ATCC 22665]|nr:cleavage polyadenylation factor subunit fip1 [Blastocladiella emersonii ATCC 22665]
MADFDDLDDFLYGGADEPSVAPASAPASAAAAAATVASDVPAEPSKAAVESMDVDTSSTTEDAPPNQQPDEPMFMDGISDGEDEESSGDDDIDIVLDAADTPASADGKPGAEASLVTLKPGQPGSSASANAAAQSSTAAATAAAVAAASVDFVDLDAPALYEGKPITEVPVESFDDKPWRRPGEDITDYFNYGFNEDTWRMYCDRQRVLREEQTTRRRMGLHTLPSSTSTAGAGHASLPPIPRGHGLPAVPPPLPLPPPPNNNNNNNGLPHAPSSVPTPATATATPVPPGGLPAGMRVRVAAPAPGALPAGMSIAGRAGAGLPRPPAAGPGEMGMMNGGGGGRPGGMPPGMHQQIQQHVGMGTGMGQRPGSAGMNRYA